MITSFVPGGTFRHQNPLALPPLTLAGRPAASERQSGSMSVLALPEHSVMAGRSMTAIFILSDSANAREVPTLATPRETGSGVVKHPGDAHSIARPGEPVHDDVSEAAGDYLEGLDLEQALIHRCKTLGMIPLQFLLWDPELLDHASPAKQSRSFLAMKRAVDIIGSLVIGLMVLPFIPLLAIAIKLNSPGPILYHQARLGLGGEVFQLYKFRSMRTDAESSGAMFCARDDPRVTRVGQVIRRTRIDELPQLWNVLIGEMSLVGPRPERPEVVEKIRDIIPEFSLRVEVKPGLTGWAQTVYHYADSAEELRRKLEYDLYYLEFDGAFLESLIALKTVKSILLREGR